MRFSQNCVFPVSPCVADTKWQDPEQDVESIVAHAYIQREYKNSGCTCGKLHVPEGASDSREVCNTSRRLVFGSSRLRPGFALDSPSLDDGPCCKLYTLVWNRLATQKVTSCWQVSNEVQLRHIVDVCKRWVNSGFASICKEKYGSIDKVTRVIRSLHFHTRSAQNAVLASCIEIYYSLLTRWFLLRWHDNFYYASRTPLLVW